MIVRENKHEFISDRPIASVEDDLLNRDKFSSDIAGAISNWGGEESLVVALYGEWGAGKSSIKNLSISKMKSLVNNKPEVVEFSPWEWAAQDKITEAFFEEISKAVGRNDKSKKGKELAATLQRYGRYLNTGEVIATGVSKLIPAVFILIALFGFGGAFSDDAWVKYVTGLLLGVVGIWIALLKSGKDTLNSFAKNSEATAKAQELSLNGLRQELKELLECRENTLVVVIDDLDRLNTEQLRMMFQLIKANSEFPNLVFWLLFQRDLVEDKMSDGRYSGREYLEKIIQVSFNTPTIETSQVREVLFKKLNKIFEKNELIENAFNSTYWGNVFHGSLHVFFGNLRDVYRFLSSFSFYVSSFQGRSAFEVNLVDLISIECLRVFEPEVYDEISRNKKILTGTRNDRRSDGDKTVKSTLELIIGKSSVGREESIRKLLIRLFPTVEWALGGTGYSEEFNNSWFRELRICNGTHFNKYFSFSIQNNEVSQSDLVELLESTSDSECFVKKVLSLQERGTVKIGLEYFEAYTNKVPLENGFEYLKGILDIGDVLESKGKGAFDFGAYIHAVRLTVHFLHRMEDVEQRSTLLLSCFQATEGVSVILHVLQAEEERREDKAKDTLVNDLVFSQLKKEYVSKIKEIADSSGRQLIEHQHLDMILYKWRNWGDESCALAWLKNELKDFINCIYFLMAFVTNRSSWGDGDHVQKLSKHINLDTIEEYVPIEVLTEALMEGDELELNGEKQDAYDAFNRALEAREKGVKDKW